MTELRLTNKRSEILKLVKEYHELSKLLTPPDDQLRVSGKVYDAAEMTNLVDASLDFWLTSGRYTQAFETRFAKYLGVSWAGVVNSGSSANLLAVSALTSHLLGDRQLKPGDEIITVAAGFPTTVNPILQVGAVPVFVDVELPTYNINPDLIEVAITPKTRAIILAHTLGNPFNLRELTRIAKQYNLWLIEDACDALGSTYDDKRLGSFGDIGTFSFYPAHHITMGEGGAVVTNNPKLQKIMTSLRDWGRDCWCETGHDDTCGRRFVWKWNELPDGYDHKYVYSHRGFNLKATDMQAAIGLAQLDKLPAFVEQRKQNFLTLTTALKHLETWLILPQPTPHSAPSWFGYPITIKPDSGLSRNELTQFLDSHKIHTRLLFGGNLTKQPYMAHEKYLISGSLENTDLIMENTFWIGVYPELSDSNLQKMGRVISEFISKQQDRNHE
mgnify:CR=1 FL=1